MIDIFDKIIRGIDNTLYNNGDSLLFIAGIIEILLTAILIIVFLILKFPIVFFILFLIPIIYVIVKYIEELKND